MAADLRERWRVSSRLDHPDIDVTMTVDSTAAWARTLACATEPETVAWLEEELTPDDVLYDVGANVGAYSLLACSLAPCRVVAFEPSPASFAALVENAGLNGLHERLVALPVALAEGSGLARFCLAGDAAGAALHDLGELSALATPAPAPTVLTFGLDELIPIAELPLPTLLKVDVDGAEARMVAGARLTLAHPRVRSILIEVDASSEAELDEASRVVTTLEDLGFEISSRHPRGPAGRVENLVFHRRDMGS